MRLYDNEAYRDTFMQGVYDLLEDDPTNERANAIIELFDSAPVVTLPNEPLTLDELREMDGEPVWLDVAGGVWALVDTDDDCVWLDRGGSIDIFRLTGKAYRRPPEGEEANL